MTSTFFEEDLRRHPRPPSLPSCASPFFLGHKHPLLTFLDAFEDPISIYDTEYNFIYGNHAWEGFFEKPRVETYGYSLFTMWADGRFTLDNPLAKMYQRAMHEQVVQRSTVFHPRMHKWIYISVYPNLEGFLVHIKDITAQKQEEENSRKIVLSNKELMQAVEERTRALNKEREVTAEVMSKSPDAVMALDKNFTFSEFNPVMERVTGKSKSEVLGKHYLEVFPGLQNPSFERILHSVLVQGNTIKNAFVEVTHQPQVLQVLFTEYFEKNYVPIIPKGESTPVGAVFFFHDMTTHKKAQEVLALQEAETAHARDEALKLAKAKSDFLANMSHEIRTPLNAVIGIGELLSSGVMDTRQQTESFTILHSNANNLLDIVNQILDFSKAEAGKLVLERHPFELGKVFYEMVKTYQMQAAGKKPRGIDFYFKVPNENIFSKTVLGDRSRLQGILHNLLGNSMKFTHSGSITLEIDIVSETDDVICILAKVCDTGIGMDRAALAKLFSPFSQADESTTRNYGGTGLGLSITKMIVECMKGTVEVDSTKGVGTTFSVHLPFDKFTKPPTVDEYDARTSSPREQQVESPGHHPPLTPRFPKAPPDFSPGMGVSSETLLHHYQSCPTCPRLNVLVAEDNPVNRHIVGLQLSKLGVKAMIVENGEEAVKALASDLERKFNLVLMDIQMPVLDGYGAVSVIRQKAMFDQLPIIAMTADALPEDRMRSAQVGMDDYLAKPLTIGSLAGMFHKWASLNFFRVIAGGILCNVNY